MESEIQHKKQQRGKIPNYAPDLDKTNRLEFELQDLCDRLDELVKNPVSAAINRKEIADVCSKIQKRLMAAHKKMYKNQMTVYEAREENQKFSKCYREVCEENKRLN